MTNINLKEGQTLPGDPQVARTQLWLNENYGTNPGFVAINPITGRTGWTTINALIRALQIELGITSTADNFGNGTKLAFQTAYPRGIFQQTHGAPTEKNIYGIIQGALWCKGYSTGSVEITKHFYEGTGDGVKDLKADTGINDTSSTVTLNVMKALLSMDQFKLVYSGNSLIQQIQRSLNNSHENYFGIIPCDGLYGRAMNTALIKVLQAIEGLDPESATGNFGPYTINNIPVITPVIWSTDQIRYGQAIKLFRFCLICNGYSLAPVISTTWDSELTNTIIAFQADYVLPQTNIGDLTTWMSLMLSKGNSDRPASACDTSEILDAGDAQALYHNGYRYIGRYLSGSVGFGPNLRPKNLSKVELNHLFNAGLRVFAIFQEGAVYLDKFTYEQGRADGVKALSTARELGVPYGEIIYFAIDYDMMDSNVSSNVIPYFKGIRKSFNSNFNLYKIGIYGARNVCSRIANADYSISSFISDMSTGFSGNMGYRIPDNWAFDQFHEFQFYHSNGSFALDKVAYSGRYNGFGELEEHTVDEPLSPPDLSIYLDRYKEILKIMHIAPAIDLTLNHEYIIETPVLQIKYEAGTTAAFAPDTASAWSTISIDNGYFNEYAIKASQEFYNGLEASLKSSFDDMGGLSLAATLSQEINNGKVSIGLGNEGGFLKVTYLTDETLWTEDNISYKLYVKITFLFRNQPVSQELINQIKVSVYMLLGASLAIIAVNVATPVAEALIYKFLFAAAATVTTAI